MPLHGNLTAYGKVELTVVKTVEHCEQDLSANFVKLIIKEYKNHLLSLQEDAKTIKKYYLNAMKSMRLNTNNKKEFYDLLEAEKEVKNYVEADSSMSKSL